MEWICTYLDKEKYQLSFIFNLVPNNRTFDKFSFRLIGILGAFQKIKAYKSYNEN
jgi:hypothetical protein